MSISVPNKKPLELSIECWLWAYSSISPEQWTIASAENLQLLLGEYWIALKTIYYNWMRGSLSSSRHHNSPTLLETKNSAISLNQAGHSYCLALNWWNASLRQLLKDSDLIRTGKAISEKVYLLLMQAEIRNALLPYLITKHEIQALEMLSENSIHHNVDNYVTVTNPVIYSMIRDKFPNLKLIASTLIKYFYDVNYSKLIADYDEVVPLNQNLYPRFLGEFWNNMDKLVAFLNLWCNYRNFWLCMEHYTKSEELWMSYFSWDSGEDTLDQEKKYLQFCDNLPRSCQWWWLVSSQMRLKKLIGIWVRKFKLQREATFSEYVLEVLINMFIEVWLAKWKSDWFSINPKLMKNAPMISNQSEPNLSDWLNKAIYQWRCEISYEKRPIKATNKLGINWYIKIPKSLSNQSIWYIRTLDVDLMESEESYIYLAEYLKVNQYMLSDRFWPYFNEIFWSNNVYYEWWTELSTLLQSSTAKIRPKLKNKDPNIWNFNWAFLHRYIFIQ